MRIFLAILLFFSFRCLPAEAFVFREFRSEVFLQKNSGNPVLFTPADLIEENDQEENESSGDASNPEDVFPGEPLLRYPAVVSVPLTSGRPRLVKTGRMHLVLLCLLRI